MKTKKKGSLTLKMLLIVGIAMFVLYVSMLATSIYSSENSTRDLYLEKLKSIALSVKESYDSMIEGDYAVKDGKFCKGDNVLDNDLIDSISDQDDVYMTLFYGDTRYLTSIRDSDGNRAVGTKASDEVIEAVLNNGEDYETDNVDILGERYYGAYEPLKNGDDVVGIIFIGIEYSKVKEISDRLTIRMAIIGTVLAIVIMLVSCISCLFIARTIKNVSKKLNTLTEGDLNVECSVAKINQNDELGNLADSTNKLAEKLREIVGRMQQCSETLSEDYSNLDGVVEATSTSVCGVTSAMEDVARGASSQAETATELMVNVQELSSNLDMISNQVGQLNNTAKTVSQEANDTRQTMRELLEINENTRSSIDAIVSQSQNTLGSVEQISGIVRAIEEITTQTNLLSLNASIEAARAGEAGKGFIVVASEIGKLAEESAQSASQITEIINNIISQVEKAASISDVLSENAGSQIKKLAETQKSMDKVISGVVDISSNTETINTDVNNLERIKLSISDAVENLSATSEENAAASEETSSSAMIIEENMSVLKKSSDNILNVSNEISDTISYFK